jgi:hypothetical protein
MHTPTYTLPCSLARALATPPASANAESRLGQMERRTKTSREEPVLAHDGANNSVRIEALPR